MEHAEEDHSPNTKEGPLSLPSKEILRDIARKQEERAREIRERRRRESLTSAEQDGEEKRKTNAAKVIQRNYRGHRERRALEGCGLSTSTRWLEV